MNKYFRYLLILPVVLMFLAKLGAADDAIEEMEAAANSDGQITPEEEAAINVEAGRISRDLLKEGKVISRRISGRAA